MGGRTQLDQLDRLPVRIPEPEEYERAAQLLERLAVDEAELTMLRQMFGYERTPAPAKLQGTKRHRMAHGTAEAVRWHDENKVPDCFRCGRWRRARAVHGTEQSCQAHYQDGTALCAACQAFYDERHSGRKKLPFGASCGTAAGYRRHMRLGEPICGPCREADSRYARELRLARESAAKAQSQAAGIADLGRAA